MNIMNVLLECLEAQQIQVLTYGSLVLNPTWPPNLLFKKIYTWVFFSQTNNMCNPSQNFFKMRIGTCVNWVLGLVSILGLILAEDWFSVGVSEHFSKI
jgi:hypothetical protein